MNEETRIAALLREGDERVGMPDLEQIRRRGRRLRTVRRAGYAGAVATLTLAVGIPVALQGPEEGSADRVASVVGSPNTPVPGGPPPASDPQFRIEYGADDPLGPDDPGAQYVLSPAASPDFGAALGKIADLGYGLYGPYEPDRGRLWAQRTTMVSGDQRTYLFLGDRHNGHYYADEDSHRRNIVEPGPWGPLSIRWFLVPTKPYETDPDWERDDPFTALFAVYHGQGVAQAEWVRSDGTQVPLRVSSDVIPDATVLWGRTGPDDTDTSGTVELYDQSGGQIASCTLAQCGVPWTDQSYGDSR